MTQLDRTHRDSEAFPKGQSARSASHACCPMCGATDLAILFHRQFRGCEYSLARCQTCGQHFCHPIPTKEELTAFYAGDFHQELRTGGEIEQVFAARFTGYRDWVLEFVRGGRSLDIGTATGLLPALLKQVGFDAEGIEYNEASAKWGEEHYGVRIRAGDLLQHRAELGLFDLISMTDVLAHTHHPLEYLRTACEHLKPGGWMFVTSPDIQSIESRYARLCSQVLRRDWIWYCCAIPYCVWEFTPATARAVFRDAGLEVVAYRRRAVIKAKKPTGVLKLLYLPIEVLKIPAIGNSFGSRMQFMLRKRD